jgi:uncharacterized protein YfaS (alpha-2-macroglobulin family)
MKKLLILLSLVTLFGCTAQSVPDGLPKLVPVTLTITQEGKPLAGAVVSLVDPGGGIQFAVGGTTDAQGNVVLHTHGKHKGAPLGKFKVRVVKTETDQLPPHLQTAPNMRSPEFGAYSREIEKLPPQKTYTLIEKRYTQSNTTPLELDITGPLTTTLDIGKAVRNVL